MTQPSNDPRSSAIASGAFAEAFGPSNSTGLRLVQSQQPSRKTIKASPFIWRDPAQIPRRQCLYPRTYYRKFVTGTVAPGGIGKTGLSIVEALAMVTGRDLLGDGFGGDADGLPLTVWFWNGEDPLEEIERQVHAAMINFNIKSADIAGRLFLDSGREIPIRVVYSDKTGFHVDADSQADITRTITENGIDVAIFDPLVSIHKAPENSNEAMDAVVKTLAQIANDTDCAMGVAAHTRKQQVGGGGEISADDARGGRALVDGARVVRVLNRMTKDDGEKAGIIGNEYKRYFWQGSDKINLTPPDEKKTWRYLESVYLPNGPTDFEGDNIRVVTSWQWPDAFADVSTADLLKFQQVLEKEQKLNRADRQSPDWAGHLLADVLGLDTGRGLTKAGLAPDQLNARSKCGSILRAWQASGALVNDIIEDARRDRRVPILRVGTWANS